MADQYPKYDSYQSAYHQAFRAELQGILDELPFPERGHVIDLPCGNGFYTARLAERLGKGLYLTAVDKSDEYLRATRNRVLHKREQVEVRKADAYELPFRDGSLDFIWSAQSLISLDPVPAVREMHRICKPDGRVAILEEDQFHHILLPWPAELEVALTVALHEASVAKYGDGAKLAPARRLRRILKEAGFQSVQRKTYPAERVAPFDHETQVFLDHHLEYLKSFAYPHLSRSMQAAFDDLSDPDSPKAVQNSSVSELECMNVVFSHRLGTKPSAPDYSLDLAESTDRSVDRHRSNRRQIFVRMPRDEGHGRCLRGLPHREMAGEFRRYAVAAMKCPARPPTRWVLCIGLHESV